MSWKRVLRAAVCFLVICCLVINISPIKSQATSVVLPALPAVMSVPGLQVVGAILIGLGICVGIATTDWNAVANNCAEWLEDQGVIDENGNCKIIQFPDPNGGLPSWFADAALIAMIWDWLFDEGYVSETAVPEGYWNYNGIVAKPYPQDVDMSVYPYITIGYFGGPSEPYCVFSTHPLFVSQDLILNGVVYWRLVSSEDVDGLVYHRYDNYETGWSKMSDKVGIEAGSELWKLNKPGANSVPCDIWVNYDLYGTQAYNYSKLLIPGSLPKSDSGEYVTVTGDLTAGVIAPQDVPLSEGYPSWYAGSTTVSGDLLGSDDDEVLVYPLGMGSTLADIQGMTQEQIWSGANASDPFIPSADSLGQTNTNSFLDAVADIIFSPFVWIWGQIKSLFIPSEGYVDAKIDAVTSEFAFADSIATTAKDLRSFLTNLGSTPPVIYIDLGASTGSYDLGGKMVLIDFSFYEPYKPMMDSILSAFLWLWFVWRVILGLPGIIAGASGIPGSTFDPSNIGVIGSINAPALSLRSSPEKPVEHKPHPSSTAAVREWFHKHNEANYKKMHGGD